MRPIFVALDTPDVHRAAAFARQLCGLAGGMKLGLEFFCANGRDGVLRIAEHGMPIFLDLKLHDIPNTVGKAVEAIAPLAPAILTVHAAGGKAMMAAAKAAAPPATKVVGVTVLTSLDANDLAKTGVAGSPGTRSSASPTWPSRLASTASSARARKWRRPATSGRKAFLSFPVFGRKEMTSRIKSVS